jgi:hypothetical protein
LLVFILTFFNLFVKKRYSIAVAFGFSAFSFTAHAQGDFRAGYIVRPNGDTLRGLVRYQDTRRNATTAGFMPAAGGVAQVVNPNELNGYGIWGENPYRARLTPQADSGRATGPSRLLFLEVLADGTPASLYRRRVGSEDTRYYLQKTATAPLRELAVKHQEVVDGPRKYTQDLPVFRGVMTEEFADCPSMLLTISKVDFVAGDLAKAVQRYNECRQPGVAATRSYQSHRHGGVELLLGVQGATLLVYGDKSATKGHYQSGLVPDIGLGAWVGSRALRDKLQARIELHYVSQKYEDEFAATSVSASGATPVLTYSQVHFNTSYLRLPLLLRYVPTTGSVRPLLEAGASANYLLQLTQEARTRATTTATFSEWGNIYDPNNVRHIEYGFLAGAGVQVTGPGRHAISLLGRYEVSNGFLDTPINSNKFHRYSLLLTLGLGKQP